MSLETWAAKKGIKLSAAAVKNVAFAILVGAACWLAWSTATTVATLRSENQALREFKGNITRQDEHTATADQAHKTAQAGAAEQDRQQTEVIVLHDRATKEAANEDPSSAAFLDAPIPDRLRRADREARRARQHEE